MAADNLFGVTLPPVQWAAGTPSREHDSESPHSRDKRARKPESKLAIPATTTAEAQVEQAAPHEVDNFA
jgi:hypothetical protein